MPQHNAISWQTKIRRFPGLFEESRQETLDTTNTLPRSRDGHQNIGHSEPQLDHSSSSPMEVLQQLEEATSPTPFEPAEQPRHPSDPNLDADFENIVSVMIKVCTGAYGAIEDEEVWRKLSQEVSFSYILLFNVQC
jgi:hypothetical protein